MDDDDEDEDEDGDGDPDAPPAPAAPLLLTSASSTSASHCWPQPPPTSTVRHIDTGPARPPLSSPAAAPHCACPARPPSVPRRRHPSAADTDLTGSLPRRAAGKARSRGARTEWDETGRGAPGNPYAPTPPRRGRQPPLLHHLLPALLFYLFPPGLPGKEK